MKHLLWVPITDKNGKKRFINFDHVEYIEDNGNGHTKVVFCSGIEDSEALFIHLSYDAVCEALANVFMTLTLALAKTGGLHGGHDPLKPQ